MDKRKREIEHQKDLAVLQNLRLMDDDFMRAAFREQMELVEFVLRILLDKPDLIVKKVVVQADMKRVTGARSVILDVYAQDSEGKIYNIEVQRSDDGALPQRARYHSSVMDVENLDARQDFSMLPETYTIILTEKDYFTKGKAFYHFERYDRENDILLDDKTHIIYINGSYRGDDALGWLMHDFNCTKASEMKYTVLAERMDYLKGNIEEVNSMCKLIEDRVNEAKIEAKIEAMIEAKIEAKIEAEIEVKNEILSVLGITEAQYEELKALKMQQAMLQ